MTCWIDKVRDAAAALRAAYSVLVTLPSSIAELLDKLSEQEAAANQTVTMMQVMDDTAREITRT